MIQRTQLVSYDGEGETKDTDGEEWMFDEQVDMCEWQCEWQYGWHLVKQVVKLQNKSFASQYMSWLLKLKAKRLKHSLPTKWLFLNYTNNWILCMLLKYIYNITVSVEKNFSKEGYMLAYLQAMLSKNVTVNPSRNELTQLWTSKNYHFTG